MSTTDAIRNTVLGLATGDALAWTGGDHREHLLPARRLAAFRRMETFADSTRSTTLPRPYVHASPTSIMGPKPSDDLEWFAWSARVNAEALESATPGDAINEGWRTLAADSEHVLARTGTQIALTNIRRGVTIPQSGHDNPHYFDDIACIRAISAGLLANSAENAAQLAELDAQVTHSLDGIWCAQAVAVLTVTLKQGRPVDAAIERALDQLPEESWSRRLADDALQLAAESNSTLDLTYRLADTISDRIYSYAVAAPETLALLLAHLKHARSADDLMLGSFAHGRNGDTLPALAGALAGLIFGADWTPNDIANGANRIDGFCVPEVRGLTLQDLIQGLEHAQQDRD